VGECKPLPAISLWLGKSRSPCQSRAQALNRPISAHHLGGTPIQSCGQRVSAPRVTAGARLNAHTELWTRLALDAGSAIPKLAYCKLHLAVTGQESPPYTGARAKAWCLLKHAEVSLSGVITVDFSLQPLK